MHQWAGTFYYININDDYEIELTFEQTNAIIALQIAIDKICNNFICRAMMHECVSLCIQCVTNERTQTCVI